MDVMMRDWEGQGGRIVLIVTGVCGGGRTRRGAQGKRREAGVALKRGREGGIGVIGVSDRNIGWAGG